MIRAKQYGRVKLTDNGETKFAEFVVEAGTKQEFFSGQSGICVSVEIDSPEPVTPQNAWQDISTAPKDALRRLSEIIRDCIYENGKPEKTLTLPDGSVHSGPVVDWVHDALSVIADISEKALSEPTAQTGEE